MKRTFSLSIGLLALLLATPAWAQYTAPGGVMNATTLNGAISATQTTLVLTSASAASNATVGAPAANQCLLIDKELMVIRSISSTTVTVTRGVQNNSTHATLAVILTGPCGGAMGGFMAADPPNIGGNQDCSLYMLPWVNRATGDSWWCELAVGGTGYTKATWTVTNTVTRNGTNGSRRNAQ